MKSIQSAQVEVCALAEQNVPRYTSYPTAPHFGKDIGPDVYALWLEQLPRQAPLSLYLHVPYCRELCLYCGCHTRASRRQQPIDAYAASLLSEIALVAERLGSRQVSHLHWGGGTPSILAQRNLTQVIRRLEEAFDLGRLREHAIELDPRHLGRSLARVLADIGVNRASLGVQEFAPHVQEAIGRIQPFNQVARAVGMLRDAGIGNINFDLMYGLPRQTVDDVYRTANQAIALAPQRIALFGYAHVPWFRAQQRLIDDALLPGPLDRFRQMSAAHEVFRASGYRPIGFDHFALPADDLARAAQTHTIRRNFQGYTSDSAEVLIGFGASAVGRLPQGFAQNFPDAGGYQRAVATARLPVVRGAALSLDDRLRGRIIENLMCELSVNPQEIAAQMGVNEPFTEEFRRLAPLVEQGIVTTDEGCVVVTEAGRPFVRVVAATFDSYLHRQSPRHSVAV